MDSYVGNVIERWAIEHDGDRDATDLPELVAAHPCKDGMHGDRVPAVCAEARRLLAGARCAEPCCADFVGFAESIDGDVVCTNTACASCWPDACPECPEPASRHTDAGCRQLPKDVEDEVATLAAAGRAPAQKWARDGRELEQLQSELREDPELRGAAGAKKRIRIEVLKQQREKAAKQLDELAERIGTLREAHTCRCARTAREARTSKGFRWNEAGGLLERLDEGAKEGAAP